MSYNQNIPLVTDYMVISQPQIKANFQAINSVFARNHVRLNSETTGNSQGMHNVLTLRVQIGDPTTTVDQIALYTKLVAGNAMLFYRPSNNQTPIQLTYPSISVGLQSTQPDVYLPQQYSYVAGPFVVYIGVISVNDGDVITLSPTTTLLYVGLVTVASYAGAIGSSAAATSITGSQFTARVPSSIVSGPKLLYYLAVGM